MPYNPRVHRRRSIRLPGCDYTQARAYFVTVCTAQKQCLLGEVVNEDVVLSDFGHIVHEEWQNTAILRPYVGLDAFVVMPNHVHGIIIIHDTNTVGAQRAAPLHTAPQHVNERNIGNAAPLHTATRREASRGTTSGNVAPGSLGAIVRSFKSTVTKRVNEARQTAGEPFWQRNYYERVIRHEEEYNRNRAYILDNPTKWIEDSENPNRLL